MAAQIPTSLLDLFSNHLILTQLAPYLFISDLFNLSVASRKFNEVISSDPSAFKRLDFSTVRGTPFDLCEVESFEEHNIFRHEQYLRPNPECCLPLTKLADTLWKRAILPTVQTLILDRQYVHVEDIRNILLDSACQIRLLSLLDVHGLDRIEFQSLIEDLFRGGRSLGSSRLEGVYFFGAPRVNGQHESPNPWYHRSEATFQPPEIESFYSSLLRVTKGVLVWDAVLCRAPRHTYPHPKYAVPPIASVALGTMGCHICHSAPEGPASGSKELPLLSPPPFHSSSAKVAQQIPSDGVHAAPLPFYARCVYCLKHRWCQMCGKWWCENCYQFGGPNCYKENNATGSDSMGSKAECQFCARLCYDCNKKNQKLYACCNTTHCLIHDKQLHSLGLDNCDSCAIFFHESLVS